MAAIGDSWASGSWTADIWATGSWKDYGPDPDGDETWDRVTAATTTWTRVSPVVIDE